jgi:hypothetical protein
MGSKSVVLKSDEGLDKGCGLRSRTSSSNFSVDLNRGSLPPSTTVDLDRLYELCLRCLLTYD